MEGFRALGFSRLFRVRGLWFGAYGSGMFGVMGSGVFGFSDKDPNQSLFLKLDLAHRCCH